ncbi:MAG: YraN family protein [Firmicutes bacterium]|nr:YraN family protein [Bacillota bacterium]
MSRRKGDLAEQMAMEYLVSRGFGILARNYTIRGAEVDIIAQEGDFIVFVEVKQRKTARFATPRESVTIAKRRRMILAAERWLQGKGLLEANIRFDIVEVLGGTVTLLRGAFDAAV